VETNDPAVSLDALVMVSDIFQEGCYGELGGKLADHYKIGTDRGHWPMRRSRSVLAVQQWFGVHAAIEDQVRSLTEQTGVSGPWS